MHASRPNVFFVLLILIATVSVVAGCASSGAAPGAAPAASAADAAPAAPAAPAKKAFQAPDFESTEYRSEEHGLIVHYPADFDEQPGQGPESLLSAASPSMVPRVDVTISPAGSSAEQFGQQIETTLSALGGGEAKVTATEETTLQDGVTPAIELLVDWSFQGFPISSVVLGAEVPSGQFASVMVTGMQGGSVDELREIAYTFYIED